jgi:hypothetical protein
MQDITQLSTVKFSDKFEISSGAKKPSSFNLRGSKPFKNKSKTSNFLEKFGDSEFNSGSEQWDIETNRIQDRIRIPDPDL